MLLILHVQPTTSAPPSLASHARTEILHYMQEQQLHQGQMEQHLLAIAKVRIATVSACKHCRYNFCPFHVEASMSAPHLNILRPLHTQSCKYFPTPSTCPPHAQHRMLQAQQRMPHTTKWHMHQTDPPHPGHPGTPSPNLPAPKHVRGQPQPTPPDTSQNTQQAVPPPHANTKAQPKSHNAGNNLCRHGDITPSCSHTSEPVYIPHKSTYTSAPSVTKRTPTLSPQAPSPPSRPKHPDAG